METEKCPFIGVDCEYIPLARKSDAQAKENERLRGILRLITELSPFKLWPGHACLKFFAEMSIEQEISFYSARLIEITTLAHEALKEKENEIF